MNITNARMIDDVRAEIASDPRIPYTEEIAVDAYGDEVTLRGTVGSFAQQQAAVDDARRMRGVVDVLDELQVRILDRDRRQDAEIRGAALQRLAWTPRSPATTSRSASRTAGSRSTARSPSSYRATSPSTTSPPCTASPA